MVDFQHAQPASYVVLCVPLLTGLLSRFAFSIKREDVIARASNQDGYHRLLPSGRVFAIVWTLLYVVMGLAWFWAREDGSDSMADVWFSILVTLLFLWTVLFGNNRAGTEKAAMYALIFIVAYALTMWNWLVLKGSQASLFMPALVSWTVFAEGLSMAHLVI